jgi:hypothetical protein
MAKRTTKNAAPKRPSALRNAQRTKKLPAVVHVEPLVPGLVTRHAPKYTIYSDGTERGLYAARRFRKGEVLCHVEGKRLPLEDRRVSHRAVQIGKNHFIEPKRYSFVWFLNHSCVPNAYVDHDRLMARRAIAEGEEITADYSLFIDVPSWDMQCCCGHERCRKVVLPYREHAEQSVVPKEFVSGYLKR